MPNFRNLLLKTKSFYKSIGKIRSIHLGNAFVIFGNSGFKHLLMKKRRFRPIKEQYRKLSLLWSIKEVLNGDIINKSFRVNKDRIYGSVEYHSITVKVKELNIKIIIRKIGNGNYHFWSIMDT